jgi:hypothetical protein
MCVKISVMISGGKSRADIVVFVRLCDVEAFFEVSRLGMDDVYEAWTRRLGKSQQLRTVVLGLWSVQQFCVDRIRVQFAEDKLQLAKLAIGFK